MKFRKFIASVLLCGAPLAVRAVEPAAYFQAETSRLAGACLADVHSLAQWQARRPELRREAAEMLGLDPFPQRTDLQPVITGKLERPDFTVEKLFFQSRPHLYVTANLYLPKGRQKSAPAILYLCGHSRVVTNGISFGAKTAYQHHGIWFARHGYVCLVIDTLQLGEIMGHHRGTYDEGAWWWNARGYTPAGVETWDAIRALDYLVSRPEVDAQRLGVTGRSGGGAYSWFVAALDDRVKVIAPVAGITDLRNYVIDGTVDGHCDCMFLVNTYRWDYPMLAALCAPRPLLLANTEADALFPLSGVTRTCEKLKQIYALYGADKDFAFATGPGPHADTPEMQAPVFRWFNLHLKHDNSSIDGVPARKMFSPEELKVFDQIPADQINTTIQESFVPAAPTPTPPATAEDWRKWRDGWMTGLRTKCFAGWPEEAGPPVVKQISSETNRAVRRDIFEMQSQEGIVLRLTLLRPADRTPPKRIDLIVRPIGIKEGLPSDGVPRAFFEPRGASTNDLTKVRRRYMLLGQTLDGMRVWDIRRAVQAIRALDGLRSTSLWIHADGDMAVNALYASLFEDGIAGLALFHLPSSHQDGPDYLNVLKILDIPSTVVMAAERCPVYLHPALPQRCHFVSAMQNSSVVKLDLLMEP